MEFCLVLAYIFLVYSVFGIIEYVVFISIYEGSAEQLLDRAFGIKKTYPVYKENLILFIISLAYIIFHFMN